MGDRHVLLTGYPGPIALRLARRLAERDGRTRIAALVPHAVADEAAAIAARGPAAVRVLPATPAAPRFGLPEGEHRALLAGVTHVHHLAGGLAATQRVVAFARAALAAGGPLERHHFVSTALVSGDRRGLVREDELAAGQGFDDAAAAEWFACEVLVAGARDAVPTTIHRPGLDLADALDRLLAPARLLAPLRLPLPQVGDGRAPLNAVPASFVAEAVAAVAHDGGALGATLHLVDPDPVTVAEATQLATEWAYGRPVAGRIPYSAARRLLPRAERGPLARLHRPVAYDTANAAPLLARLGVRCPPFAAGGTV